MSQITTAGRYYLMMGTAASVFFCAAALGRWPSPDFGSGGAAGFGTSGRSTYGNSSGSSSFGRTTGGFWGGGK